MYKITIVGFTYKSKFNSINDQIKTLPFSFVLNKVIKENEYNKNSNEKLNNLFNTKMKIEKIDGRLKETKKLTYFSWILLKTLNVSRNYFI